MNEHNKLNKAISCLEIYRKADNFDTVVILSKVLDICKYIIIACVQDFIIESILLRKVGIILF